MSSNLREKVVRCCTVGQGPASRRTGRKFLTQLSDGLLNTLSTMTGLYGYELPFHTRVYSQGMDFSTANVSR